MKNWEKKVRNVEWSTERRKPQGQHIRNNFLPEPFCSSCLLGLSLKLVLRDDKDQMGPVWVSPVTACLQKSQGHSSKLWWASSRNRLSATLSATSQLPGRNWVLTPKTRAWMYLGHLTWLQDLSSDFPFTNWAPVLHRIPYSPTSTVDHHHLYWWPGAPSRGSHSAS